MKNRDPRVLCGRLGTYATNNTKAPIPFWLMVFKNIGVFFLGSEDFPKEAKMQAAQDINGAVAAGWAGFEIAERIPLAEIARAHELVEHPQRPGRIVVTVYEGIHAGIGWIGTKSTQDPRTHRHKPQGHRAGCSSGIRGLDREDSGTSYGPSYSRGMPGGVLKLVV